MSKKFFLIMVISCIFLLPFTARGDNGNGSCCPSDLTITKEVDPSCIAVKTKEMVTFTITITNDGDSDAEGVTVSDALPQDITGAEYWIGSLTGTGTPWTGSHTFTGAIPPGESKIIYIQGELTAPDDATIIPNTATVQEGEDGCPVSASVNLRICPETDLGIEKYDEDDGNDWFSDFYYRYDPAENDDDYVDRFHDPVTAGGSILDYTHDVGEEPYKDPPLTYAIKVTNHGASDAANVMLEDAFA
jgi:uncharacterized repeat protein (TIGR01451 family)